MEKFSLCHRPIAAAMTEDSARDCLTMGSALNAISRDYAPYE